VTIYGSNFGSAGTVTFNGVSATVVNWSATSITVTVPSGATTGPLAVTVTGGYSANYCINNNTTVANFTVPLSIATTSLPTGTQNASYSATLHATGGTPPYTWSISGGSLQTGLSLNQATGVVSGTPTSSGTISFIATVSDATTASTSKGMSLTVTSAAPVIGSPTPTKGSPGMTLTISGSGFGSSQGSVTIGGLAAAIQSWSPTYIVLTIPAAAKSGGIVVTTAAGIAGTPWQITIGPTKEYIYLGGRVITIEN
jgi:hypothetical protein